MSLAPTRQTQIMTRLTNFPAPILPLTIIAGVYGMTFAHMPELHAKYGYYALWIIMIVVVSGMLIFFRRRGWIGKSEETETPTKDLSDSSR
jgi:magnesium transporter